MNNVEKTIIVINGKGGCGKDTLCEIAAKKYGVMNVSSITPIKEMAELIGWNGSKSDKDRKFLSDLKSLVTEYNDGANEYLLCQVEKFLKNEEDLMFVHIREPEMIEHFINSLEERKVGINVISLLVKRPSQKYLVMGNRSDDEVDNYNYDIVFENDVNLEELDTVFLNFLDLYLRKIDYKITLKSRFTISAIVTNDTDETWNDKYLRVIDSIDNSNKNGPKFLKEMVKVPRLKPGESISVHLNVDSGETPGIYTYCCIICDSELQSVSIDNIMAFTIAVE